jgi:hypothetical protein
MIINDKLVDQRVHLYMIQTKTLEGHCDCYVQNLEETPQLVVCTF